MKVNLNKIAFWIILTIVTIWIVHPFAWMTLLSFTPEEEILSRTPRLPSRLTLDPYFWVLGLGHLMHHPTYAVTAGTIRFEMYYFNAAVPSIFAAVVTAVLSTFAGYGLARFKSRRMDACGVFYLTMQFLPGVLLIIPWYIMFRALHLLDTLLVLAITYIAGSLPWGTWMMRSFILGLPEDLEEAALIDGCTRRQVIYKIVMPLVAPGFVAVLLFTFTSGWNAYMIPLVLAMTEKSKPIALAITELIGWYGRTYYGGIMALCVLTTLPMCIVFVYLQKFIISGMTRGAIKA